MKKRILVLVEDQYHKFYEPLRARIEHHGYEPWILAQVPANAKRLQNQGWHVLSFEDLLQFENHKSSAVKQVIEWGFDLEEMTQFERAALQRPEEFRFAYAFTIDQVKTIENARRIAATLLFKLHNTFRKLQPVAVFTWNGRYLPLRAVVAACKHWQVPLFTFEIGWLPNTMFCDFGELNSGCMTLDGADWNTALSEPFNIEGFLEAYRSGSATMVQSGISMPASEVKRHLDIGESKKILFYGCQVDWDTNIVVGAPHYASNEMALADICEAIKHQNDIEIIVKLHPLDTVNRRESLQSILQNRGCIVEKEIHLHSLINASDIVVIRNSTVGFEALCYEKPIIVLAPSKYAVDGVVWKCEGVHEIRSTVTNILDHSEKGQEPLYSLLSHLVSRYLLWSKFDYHYSKDSAHKLEKYATTYAENALFKKLESLTNERMTADIATIDWGSFSGEHPIDQRYGLDRGLAIDRFYIERFLRDNSTDIRGVCLEVLGTAYTKQFGGDNVRIADVLDIDPENPNVTVVTDLQNAACIPDNTYDCFIMTQTIHVISDYMACIREAHRILKTGGVLLATVPAISRVDVAAGQDNDFWRMTVAGANVAFGSVFGKDNIQVKGYGNVKVGTAFWQGLAQEDLSKEDLEFNDPNFPILITIRAIKQATVGETKTIKKAPNVYSRIAKEDPSCIVLLYHRVAELELDPNLLAVSPATFKQHLSFLTRKYEVLSPSDFVRCVESNHWPESPSVMITFDDGYQDNLLNAAPILKEYGAPALFFVSSGYIGSCGEFWWDDLERCILSDKTPDSFEVPSIIESELRVYPTVRYDQRYEMYKMLQGKIRKLHPADIRITLDKIREWSGASFKARETHRILSVDELKQLDMLNDMEIGSHTVDHALLSKLTGKQQRQEIGEDYKQLSQWLNRPIRLLSYPFGGTRCQDKFTYTIAWESGYRYAFLNDTRRVYMPREKPFKISRFICRDWSIPELRNQIDACMTVKASSATPSPPIIPDRSHAREAVIIETWVKRYWYSLKYEHALFRVALFGAGKHTEWLLTIVKDIDGPEVTAIFDDNADSIRQVLDRPVLRPDKNHDAKYQAVIISSDSQSKKLLEKAQRYWPDKMVVNLYNGLPEGPYPKIS